MDEQFTRQINTEVEAMSINDLTQLGNQAVSLGLIIGHGYHRNQYEILYRGQVFLLSPKEALNHLKNLITQVK